MTLTTLRRYLGTMTIKETEGEDICGASSASATRACR
jgi:hypothetical protein